MRKFGILHSLYWHWATEHDLDDGAMTLGAYLLTCQHSNSLGVFRCPISYISGDFRRGFEWASKGLQSLSEAGFLMFCEESETVFLPNYLRWNPLVNKNQFVGAINRLEDLPASFSMIDNVLDSLEKHCQPFMEKEEYRSLFEAHRKRFRRGFEGASKGLRTKEKEKEKEKEKDINTSCPEPACGNSEPDDPAEAGGEKDAKKGRAKKKTQPEDTSPPFLDIPLIPSHGSFTVTTGQVAMWQEGFPGINVETEVRKCQQWNLANTQNRKTKSGIMKHIVAWLSRAQDKAARITPAGRQQQQPGRKVWNQPEDWKGRTFEHQLTDFAAEGQRLLEEEANGKSI